MFILANGELEGLIWLVVIAMWGLGQLVNAIKKSQEKSNRQRQQPQVGSSRPPERESGPASLQDFLDSIGEQKRKMQSNPPPSVPKLDIVNKAPPKPGYKNKKDVRRKASNIENQGISIKSHEIGEPDHSKPISSRNSFRSYKLPSLKLPNAGNSFAGLQNKKPPRIDFKLRDNETFKKAILYQAILGKPKSLQKNISKINY